MWLVSDEQLLQAYAGTSSGGAALGDRVVALHPSGGLHLRVLPDRGLDVGAAWYRGEPVSWRSVLGETRAVPGDWLAGWGGGLLTTCGLRNVGLPSQGQPQHGTFTGLRAGDLRVDRDGDAIVVRATLLDETPFGPVLRVDRTLTVRAGSAVLAVDDVTTNLGSVREQAPILYHLNLGAPFLGPRTTVVGDFVSITARDADSAAHGDGTHELGPVVDDERDDVHEHDVRAGPDGWAQATALSPDSGLAVQVRWDTSTLPRLHVWRRTTRGSYVMGIEPANCSVLGRAADAATGSAPYLDPGRSRRTRVQLTVHPT
jgi:hypothetical protein